MANETVKLFSVGANESIHGVKPDMQVRSSAALFRAFTNNQIHPLFVEECSMLTKDTKKEFSNTDHQHVMEFLKQYTSKEGTFVPLPLLHGLVKQDLVFSHQEPLHPSISPHMTHISGIIGQWEQEIPKMHPDIIETTFGCSKKPKEFLKKVKNDLETYKYHYTDPKPNEHDTRILEHDIDQDFIATRASYLPLNIFEPPNIPARIYRGSCLRSFHTANGNLFLLHIGGKNMSSIILSKFEDHGKLLEEVMRVSSPTNIPGEILQLELQHDIMPSKSYVNRIVARFMYHCLILDLSASGDEFSFNIIECLAFDTRLGDVKVSKYTGYVMCWPIEGDLCLWENSPNLRIIYKRYTAPQKIKRMIQFQASAHTTTAALVTLPFSPNCLTTFTSHPKSSIITEGGTILSFDFREPTCIQRPLYILDKPNGASEILGLRYDFDHPFMFAVNTNSTLYLFDERYTASPVKEWDQLIPRDPSYNLQFLKKSSTCLSYEKDSIIAWNGSGRTSVFPYDISDRTWKTTTLRHISEPGYILPGFSTNTHNSYLGLINGTRLSQKKLAAKRFDPELETIGNHVCWLNSIESASQEFEDQLVLIQLSRCGDIYSECFDFNISPSLMHKSNSLWFDAKGHQEQILKRNPETKKISLADYLIYDAMPFLHDIIEKSHEFIKPKNFAEFVKERAPRSQVKKKENQNEGNINIKSISAELLESIDRPRSLFDVWNEAKKKLPGLDMKKLHKYLIKRSALLMAFSFPGEQSHLLQKNPIWNKLIQQTRQKSKHRTKYYVWAVSNTDIDSSLEIDQFLSDSDSDDIETQQELPQRTLKSNHIFGFCVMYCSKEIWDNFYGDNYERELPTKQSSMIKTAKNTTIREPDTFQPGDFRNRTGYRTNRVSNIPVHTRISRSDYAIDFSRLKLAWNVNVPKDMERVVGSKLSEVNTPLSQESSTPRSQVRTGASVIRKQSGLSQFSQSASQEIEQESESQHEKTKKTEKPKIISRDSSQSSKSQTIEPSQEDFSMLFSLLGSDEDD